jgi:hypothetical protein
MNTFVPIT